jgi:Domain of unknown function (DUF4114)
LPQYYPVNIMADIALGQSITGSFTSASLKDRDGNYYAEYNLTGLDSFRQLTIEGGPKTGNNRIAIDLINSVTGAIIDENSTQLGMPTTAILNTTYPGINYKVRISGVNLEDYVLSTIDGGKATTILSSSGYIVNNGRRSATVGTVGASGAYFPLAGGRLLSDLALAPNGKFYGVSRALNDPGSQLNVIDPSLDRNDQIFLPSANSIKDASGNAVAGTIESLEFTPDRKLYAISGDETGDKLYSIDPTTAVATLIGSLPTGFQSSSDLVYDAANSQFFATSRSTDPNSDALWSIPIADPTKAKNIGQLGLFAVGGLSFEGGQLTGYTPNRQVSIDPTTGAATVVRSITGLFGGESITGATTLPAATPNPTPTNSAPTGIVFSNAVTTLASNTSTANRIKVADLAITDDGLGTNNLTLTGTDANSFELAGNALFLKAGVDITSSTKTSFSTIVNVDDPTVGATPDATKSFTLTAIPTPPPVTPLIPGISITADNLFVTDSTFRGLRIAPVSQKSTSKINEIGAFVVDDATGKIGGIAPGAPGYLQAAASRIKPIFSALNGSFFSTTPREVALDPNQIYEFFEVQDGSINEVQQQIAAGKIPTNVLLAQPDASGKSLFKLTPNSTNDGYRVSVNNDELVLNVTKLAGATPNVPIGAKSQGLAQGRTIDLTDYAGKTLKADIVSKSDAAYNNNIGFYAVEDAIGTIKTAAGTFKPGDANYAIEAIKSAVLSATKTDSKSNQDLVGGKIYAPVLVAQGTLADFISKNPTNGGDGNAIHAYFNYLGANPDKVDHFRLLGDNTFGVEDLYGGGDRDFNDLVININVKDV